VTTFSADHRTLYDLCMTFVASPTGFAALPEAVRTMMAGQLPGRPGGSVVDSWVNIGELMFANRADINDDAHRLGAQCAFMCRMNGFSTLGGERGWAVQQALQREAGDEPPAGAAWPDPGDDPDPLEAWVPPAE
jgi:hypothetical protein